MLQNNSSGLGNISKTTIQNNIGVLSKGQWLGEEYALLQIPLLYTAVPINGDAKLIKIQLTDFQSKIPQEVRSALEVKTMEKMDWVRERLEKIHNTRKEI